MKNYKTDQRIITICQALETNRHIQQTRTIVEVTNMEDYDTSEYFWRNTTRTRLNEDTSIININSPYAFNG